MKKNKLPRWIRLIRYYINCLWYYLIYPIGDKEDEFTKAWKIKK